MTTANAESESSRPLGLALTDLLGPLPEPAAWQCYWRGDNDSVSWDQWHDASDPPPATWDGDPPDEVTPHYTEKQMLEYAGTNARRMASLVLMRMADEPPINGNDLARMRVLLAASSLRRAPIWTDSPQGPNAKLSRQGGADDE